MADDVINLGAARAARSGSPCDWSVVELIERVRERIKSGEINPACVYIAMAETDAAGITQLHYGAAGASGLELLGLLAAHLNMHSVKTE